MSSEVQKWADSAMFKAQPMEVRRPTVHLLSMTPDPLGSLAAAAKMYKGEVVKSLADITDDERRSYFDDMTKTVLNAAFEVIDFHFIIDGVTRAFTHQLVRQRTAVYFQESMRFAVIDESFADRVALPPSLEKTVGEATEATERYSNGELTTEEHNRVFEYMSHDERQRNRWDVAVNTIESVYKGLVADGMPAEEARGLLPTNIMTRIEYKTNLRNLVQHAGLRLCTQAQFEWRWVFSQIANAIRTARLPLPAPVDLPVHMADKISDTLFRPICYQTGKCEFMASFDRACSIRDRVQMNHEVGRPSSEWHESTVGKGYPINIAAINPAEWLMDDTAARS